MIIKMAEEAKQNFLDMALQKIHPNEEEEDPSRVAMDGDDYDDDACEYESTSVESSMEDSANSAASFSSIDLLEDASSSSSSSSLISHANGPLYELSELMTHLPIKRGLSKFYQGKSQSYTSLASVRSIEDLAKRVSVNPLHRSKMKSCKSYAGVLDSQNKYYSPKATISKRASSYQRRSFLSSLGKRGSLVGDC